MKMAAAAILCPALDWSMPTNIKPEATSATQQWMNQRWTNHKFSYAGKDELLKAFERMYRNMKFVPPNGVNQ